MQGGSDDSDRRTAEQVDDDLGKVLTEAVASSHSARRWSRVLSMPVMLDILLSVALLGGFLQVRHNAEVACERVNRVNAAYVRQWTPVLRAPRAPLREGASAEERDAYEANTALRVQFERDLRAFDPIDC